MTQLFNTRLTMTVMLLLLFCWVAQSVYAVPPTRAQNCKTRWVGTATNPDFGTFANLSGVQTITMNTSGSRTATPGIDLVTSTTVVYTATIDNTLSPLCAAFGITIDWNVPPSDLTLAGGNNITFTNIQAEYPAGSLNTLPITIYPTSLPITIPFQMTIQSTGLQQAGTYVSGPFSLSLTQVTDNVTRTGPDSTATATAIVPLVITQTVPMDFGTVAGGPQPGTVILNTSGGRATSGDGQILASGAGVPATFQITGQGGQAYSISYTIGVLDDAGSGMPMTVDTFTDTSSGSIPAGGTETINVGATLNINANQAAGSYSTATGGTPYTVTINYN